MMEDVTLVETLAEQLAARTDWVWRPTGPVYTAAETPIYYGRLAAAPDRGVGVTAYADIDDAVTGLAIRRVQVRYRGAPGDPRGADALADTGFATLQRLARVAGLSLVTRVMVAQLGTDENDRQERADSYQIIIDNPEA